MQGMNAATGKPLSGREHLVQRIRDILTTPIGTRLRRRDYGSLLPFLIDQPQNALTRIKAFAATALALLRWEPEYRLKRVALRYDASGQAELDLEGDDLARPGPNSTFALTVPIGRPSGAPQPA